MIRSFVEEVEVQTLAAYASAASSGTTTSSAIDMEGYESVCVDVKLGIVSTGGLATVKFQQSSDDAVADAYSDLEASQVVSAGDASTLTHMLFEIKNPQKRYLKCLVTRSVGNVVIDSITAFKFGCKAVPVAQGASVESVNTLINPAEGTA